MASTGQRHRRTCPRGPLVRASEHQKPVLVALFPLSFTLTREARRCRESRAAREIRPAARTLDSPIKTIYVGHMKHCTWCTRTSRKPDSPPGLVQSPSPEARSVALWTLGKIHYEQGRLPDHAADDAASGADQWSGRGSHRSKAPCGSRWQQSGGSRVHHEGAACARSSRTPEGVEVGRLVQQRAFVLFHLGEWHDADRICQPSADAHAITRRSRR